MKSAASVSVFVTGITCLVASLLSGCANMPNQAYIEHDGLRLSQASQGNTPPTVVFQSGLGDDMSVWSSVIHHLPATVSLFAYDRPGYGGSASAKGHRDPCTIARELHGVLQQQGLRPPYVLVGHSLGGLYQYAFTKLYPNEVGAVLLVDATHPDYWATIQARAENTAVVLKGLRAVAFTDTERREFDEQAVCVADLKSAPPVALPAKYLARGKAEVGESAEFQALSRELVAQWPLLIPGMVVSRVEGAGHYIQKTRPELVANEILELLARAKAQGK